MAWMSCQMMLVSPKALAVEAHLSAKGAKFNDSHSGLVFLIVTSCAIDKKLEIDKKKLENKLEIDKNSKLNSKLTKISKINSKFIAILNSKINSKFSSF